MEVSRLAKAYKAEHVAFIIMKLILRGKIRPTVSCTSDHTGKVAPPYIGPAPGGRVITSLIVETFCFQ